MDKVASLPVNIRHILQDKGTEPPFSGNFITAVEHGSYICRGCGAILFCADNQFTSHCGWPSFDDEMPNAITRTPDADGRRTEILCSTCHSHLGHVFEGEGYTPKNLRHCVNSLAIEFINDENVTKTEEAIVAGGCFWGVQYLFEQLDGVLLTEVGYTGGHQDNPSYEQVCRHDTGHVEALRIVYDSDRLNYETVLKYFLEIHDPTQQDGQGPDVGSQYLSVIFYYDKKQKQIAEQVLAELTSLGFNVATQLKPVTTFWPAENYHQHYYDKKQQTPYCHMRVKRFAK